MTLSNRLRLWGGVLLVLVLAFALTLLFNQRQHRASSVSATVDAPQAVISSEYGGVVTDSFVSLGDPVREGDRLFTVSSLSLQQDVANGVRPQSTVAYDLDIPRGTVTYKAVSTGYVGDWQARDGSYLPNGSEMATIVADGQRRVVGTYILSPGDYGRLERGTKATVFLPNNERVEGRATGVRVVTEEGRAIAEVQIESEDLANPAYADLTRPGTPVSAVVDLRDDGILAGPTDSFLTFLTKIGLR